MKLLLDQGLPRSAAPLLCNLGIDTLHVGAIGLAEADDAGILRWGQKRDYTIVTLDADFHLLLALSGAVKPSVVRIRIEGLRAAAIVALLRQVLASCAADLEHGAMVTVQPGRIRVRRLPVLQPPAEGDREAEGRA